MNGGNAQYPTTVTADFKTVIIRDGFKKTILSGTEIEFFFTSERANEETVYLMESDCHRPWKLATQEPLMF